MNNDLPSMLQKLSKVFPSGPSWPFRTQSARTVWSSIEKVFDAHPEWSMDQITREGFAKSGVPGYELTPEDLSVLGMATRWKSAVIRQQRGGAVAARVTPLLPPAPTPTNPPYGGS